MPLWLASLLFLLAINLAAFTAFGSDKQRARRGERRIAERHLLLLALFGGTLGAYLGRWAYRHKTRKKPFSIALHVIAIAQLTSLVAIVWRSLALQA